MFQTTTNQNLLNALETLAKAAEAQGDNLLAGVLYGVLGCAHERAYLDELGQILVAWFHLRGLAGTNNSPDAGYEKWLKEG